MKICGILLAAGAGTRFGGKKMTAKLAGGKILGLASYENLLASVPNSIVVINANDTLTKNLYLGVGAKTTLCELSNLGMSHSLIHGVSTASDCDGWIIALGDMPFIKKNSIDRIAAALSEGALLAVPQYMQKNGHPVGFSNKLKSEILGLKGDSGAKTILESYRNNTAFIETNDPGILMDIDKKEDLPPK